MALFINTTLATMRVAAGEPIVFSYQPQNGSGVAESLDGRSFVFSIYDNSRNNLGVYNAIVKTLPKPRALWKLSGNISEALLGKSNLRWEIAERLDDGRDIIASGTLTVEVSAPPIADYDNAPISRYIAQITRLNDQTTKAAPEFDVKYVFYSDAAPPRAVTYPKAGDLVFGLSPYRTIGNGTTTLAYAPTSGFLNEVADNFMPPQPAGHRFVYLNFGFNSVDSAGPTALETPPGNTNTIDGSVTFTAANGSGTRVAGTFGGMSSITMADGGFAIEDARPAFAGGFHRVSLTTPSGGKRPTGWNADPVFGEYRRRNSAPVAANLNGGTITSSAPDNLRGYKPHAVLVPFSGSTPSVLLIGDSITAQNDLRPDARQLVGGIVKALGDPGGTGSFGVANFGHHGAAMEDFMDITAGSNKFSQRYALLAAVRDMNGGRWPFTHIWSQGLRNDFSGFSTPTNPDDALAMMKVRAQAWWNFLAATFPGIPIIQSTVSTRVTSSATTNYTTLEGQDPRPYTAGVALEQFNEWLVNTSPSPLAMVVDLRGGQRELRPDVQFAGQSPVWARLAFVKAGGGSLATALTAGVAVTSVTLNATIAPAVGSACYFEPGTSSSEIRGNVAAVTDNGNGSFTVTLAASITPTYAHAVGSIFATSPTTDGTHPESVVHDIWAEMIKPLKPLIANL